MKREIVFTDAAIDLIKWERIKRGEFAALLDMLKEIAALPNPAAHYAVTAVKCTDENWYRAKDAKAGLRVIFEYDAETMTVHAILRRTENCYKWVEIWYNVESVAA